MMIGSPLWIGIAASSGAFLPNKISGLKLWLDADSQYITLNSGNVSSWADRSGEGNDLAQATAVNQPAPVAGWRNGRDAIQGASGDFLSRATLTGGAIAQAFTVYIVCETSSGTGTERICDGASSSRAIFGTTTVNQIYAGSFVGTTSKPSSSPAIVRAVFDGSSSSIRIEPHGASVLSETSLSPGASSLNGFVTGALQGGSSPWLGKYANFLVYSGTLSAGNDALVRSYLRTRYNIVHS